MFKTGHKTKKECSQKPTQVASWKDTAGRKWTEVECNGCGLHTRKVNGAHWRSRRTAALTARQIEIQARGGKVSV